MNKLKVLFLSLCLSVAAVAFAAMPQMYFYGSTSYERYRVARLAQSLDFTKEPMPSPWAITILSEDVFNENLHKFNIETDSAYTILEQQETFLNEYYLVYANDAHLKQTIAHEAGHLICECKSESKANDIAYQLQK